MKIVVTAIFPPIPERDHDYVAYIDGEEESGRCGYGATALAALKNFIEYYEDYIT